MAWAIVLEGTRQWPNPNTHHKSESLRIVGQINDDAYKLRTILASLLSHIGLTAIYTCLKWHYNKVFSLSICLIIGP